MTPERAVSHLEGNSYAYGGSYFDGGAVRQTLTRLQIWPLGQNGARATMAFHRFLDKFQRCGLIDGRGEKGFKLLALMIDRRTQRNESPTPSLSGRRPAWY